MKNWIIIIVLSANTAFFLVACKEGKQQSAQPEILQPKHLGDTLAVVKTDSLPAKDTAKPNLTLPPYQYKAPGACGQQIGRYIAEVKNRGLPASFDLLERQELGCKYRFTLPLKDLQQGFIWMKTIFNVPSQIKFPQASKTVIADPQNPIAANRSRAAEYITQIMETEQDDTGKISAIKWLDDDEAGFIKVSLHMEEHMAVFEVEGGGH